MSYILQVPFLHSHRLKCYIGKSLMKTCPPVIFYTVWWIFCLALENLFFYLSDCSDLGIQWINAAGLIKVSVNDVKSHHVHSSIPTTTSFLLGIFVGRRYSCLPQFHLLLTGTNHWAPKFCRCMVNIISNLHKKTES